MMLPFTGMLVKILDGTKTMTTREDATLHYWKFITKPESTRQLDPWWTNPRHLDPDRYKIGIVPCHQIGRKLGHWFTEDDAHDDGFDSIVGYRAALAQHHHMTPRRVDETVWTQMRWREEDWLDGPHLPPEDSRLWDTMPELRRLR